jgi:prepilin-type N-terminal cleavage/methylation domain-containing protein
MVGHETQPAGWRRGFSTLELMLVMTIMGMMAAITLTRIDLAKFEANSAVQVLSTSMVAAQREAITKQHDIILTFDAPQRTVRIIWDRDSDGAIDNGERIRAIPLEGRIGFGLGGAPPRAFGANPINFDREIAGRPTLIFHRNGSASGIGGFYLTTSRAMAASGHATDTRAVEIVRATGRTEWHRWTGSAWKRGF